MKSFSLFLTFLRLGLTSFGGPVAHLGYFHETFVRRKRWLSENSYAQLVALCQVLPGPASSQVGISIGLLQGGVRGSIAAWLGFTLPSALLIIIFAFSLHKFEFLLNSSVLRGLKLAAVVVVVQALVMMSKALCPDLKRKLLAIVIAAPLVVLNHPGLHLGLILLSGLVGTRWFQESGVANQSSEGFAAERSFLLPHRTGLVCLLLLAFLLVAIPVLSLATGNIFLILFDKLFRSGALVFGGGHVVLPLLVSEFVEQAWLADDVFLAGYGAAQALPGPLFSFAGFLGTTSFFENSEFMSKHFFMSENSLATIRAYQNILPWLGGIVALVAVFLPSFLILFGVLPFWQRLNELYWMRGALSGVNAGVVGLLLAALVHPVSSTAIKSTSDVGIILIGLALIFFVRAPSWAVVLLCAALTVLQASV